MGASKKLILVLGGTGAQGRAVVDALLTEPSPYSVRVMTRHPENNYAQALAQKGVEVVVGMYDFPSVAVALKGCYGVWVNVDTFTVGAKNELHWGVRIFELARSTSSLRHYVWSGLDYSLKISGWNPRYEYADYHNAKGRVQEYLKAQTSIASDTEMSWTIVSTSPYMDMLQFPVFGPVHFRDDGTAVFASAIGDGHVPMITLTDLGYFARYAFDHRESLSAEDIKVTSDVVGWDYLVETYTKVTGQPAVHVRQTMDEWFNNFKAENLAMPLAPYDPQGTTRLQNFTSWWAQWHDDLIKRDMDWIRSIHPNVMSLETWMRKTNYTGRGRVNVLKDQDGRKELAFVINRDVTNCL
ncbi:NAD(P)-binding protein [Fistulina hepatica ATCC 64428]|uniref:NAD(P)-binding protein n=1 Tax=Fistulina hepatica ATCC 64428 TaxID=1128425 RepID=A0A0D7A7E4_9AGAR|nr:NAD(P)-binding protein [Fistulina hepatica ATCC 64428]